jgi:hypothetical protein
VICAHSKKKVFSTSVASINNLSLQQKQVEGIMEEYIDNFSSPARVLKHYQVNHLIDLSPGAPLPNGPMYHHSLMENEKMRRNIQELLQKGHIIHNSSPCGSPIVLVQKKDGTW